MVTKEQIKKGMARYLDMEIMPKLDGWKRWVFGAGATAYLDKTDKMFDLLRENQMLALLDLVDDDDMIDLDVVYKAFRQQAEHCPANIALPLVGTFTFSVGDIDNLYSYILRS